MRRNLFLWAAIGLLAIYWAAQLYAILFAAHTHPVDRYALAVLLLSAFLLFNALVLRGATDRKPDPRFWYSWWSAALVWLLTLAPLSRMLQLERLL